MNNSQAIWQSLKTQRIVENRIFLNSHCPKKDSPLILITKPFWPPYLQKHQIRTDFRIWDMACLSFLKKNSENLLQ